MLSTVTAKQAGEERTGDTLTGVLSRVRFHQANFAIIEIETPSDGRAIAKGNMLAPQVGLEYTLRGKWEVHPRWGDQFAIESYETNFPTDTQAIRYYLQENCKWIGPNISRRLVEQYGEKTLPVCKESPGQVAKDVPGITLVRAREIAATLRRNEHHEKMQLELKAIFGGTKVTRTAIQNMIAKWGDETVSVVRKNPYKMVDEIEGVGFLSADDVARKLGVKHDAPERVAAGIVHTLKEAANGGGHVCLPRDLLEHDAAKLLGVSPGRVSGEVGAVVKRKAAVESAGHVYLPWLHRDEQLVAEKLKILARQKVEPRQPVMDGLQDDQVEAIKAAVGNAVFILTGAPGTGKTYTIKRLIESFPDSRMALAAPTGKAAKRIFEQSGVPASTIHKLLEPKPVDGKFVFTRNRENPLPHDLIILDEVSMISVDLMASFLDAVPPSARLILVGDTYQLPAVGPGNVLRDLLASSAIPSVELTVIKRQDPGLIIVNSHRIKAGQDITVQNGSAKDFFFLARSGEDEIRQTIIELVTKRLPENGYDPLADVQVISPRREKLKLSCGELNLVLQAKLNAKNPAVDGIKFRVGDKMIQRKNDYENDIINGDIGIVRAIEVEGKEKGIVVAFSAPERVVKLPLKKNDLDLAYALTVHSYQGSEARVVVIPVHSSFGGLLMQRPLIYTAISRAQELCVLVGQREEVGRTIRRNRPIKRHTRLAELLR